MNLVVNARDAMPNGGKLVIFTSTVEIDAMHVERNPQARLGSRICLGVTDTGCGMSAETLSHIFEPFFTTKEIGKGTGLGLATVYGVVAQQEGWIEVTSEVGHGTTLKIFLPVSADAAQSVRGDEAGNLSGGDETILVVEDEPSVREIMTHVLRQQGYRVLEASDGPEALKLWTEHGSEVDLLVTDIVMPNGLNGNALADQLRAEKEELKVIFSSGYSSDFGTGDKPLGEGLDFLQKPYKPEVLAGAVRRALDGNRSVNKPALPSLDKAA
jgi:CheY-like chemotaxis protein